MTPTANVRTWHPGTALTANPKNLTPRPKPQSDQNPSTGASKTPSIQAASSCDTADAHNNTGIDFDVGVPAPSATLDNGTSGFVSG